MKYLDKVNITERYKRAWSGYHDNKISNYKHWVKHSINVTGVIIGFRTLSNGVNHSGDYGETYYEAKEHFKVAVVVYSPNENPVYVPLDSIKEIK